MALKKLGSGLSPFGKSALAAEAEMNERSAPKTSIASDPTLTVSHKASTFAKTLAADPRDRFLAPIDPLLRNARKRFGAIIVFACLLHVVLLILLLLRDHTTRPPVQETQIPVEVIVLPPPQQPKPPPKEQQKAAAERKREGAEERSRARYGAAFQSGEVADAADRQGLGIAAAEQAHSKGRNEAGAQSAKSGPQCRDGTGRAHGRAGPNAG